MTTLQFNQNVNQIEDLLFGFAMKLTKDREGAKDLMQETLMRSFANKERFSMGTNFKAWMTTIMRNCYINEYRKRRTRNKVEQPIEENMEFASKKAVQNMAGQVMMMKELSQMLNSMKDSHKVPFKMFFDGYEYQEISETLDLPMGTVKSRIFFARKKMKAMIVNRYGTEQLRRA